VIAAAVNLFVGQHILGANNPRIVAPIPASWSIAAVWLNTYLP
jgi:hypothetical protein